MCKNFSIDNMVSTQAVFMIFLLLLFNYKTAFKHF